MSISSNTEIDTVIFDLGAVLIDWNPEYLYRKIFDREEDIQHFLNHVCTPSWNAQQDAGRTWAEATELLTGRHPEYTTEIRAFRERWTEMLNGPIAGTVEILQELEEQGRHRLLALTNWSAETWPYAWERYDFLQIFEGILVSGAENLKKPDPKIYQLLVDRYGIEPDKAVFIDDSMPNITAAREFGIHAIHFTDPAALRATLEQAGII
ncbi:HAD family hydrolase [Flavilitoribacter nigricans]|uniref:HAD family hydrolase n=1 Tax=Flavilitoribacter nigricans (strain ATCC 23147 / DSM 23189 / NBRC 102662 / NCIMB 1420 / SS-2) TaxID=1122177 RepID=A0A2D0N4A1_FLAN2|nr:HAD family phosphatase [Flavilitoribacter nigricans]PHN02969.1 HAD family hydrolase [Flavilitoribacter nigricans DSM 23189 = NBRC 102662]